MLDLTYALGGRGRMKRKSSVVAAFTQEAILKRKVRGHLRNHSIAIFEAAPTADCSTSQRHRVFANVGSARRNWRSGPSRSTAEANVRARYEIAFDRLHLLFGKAVGRPVKREHAEDSGLTDC